MVVWVGLTDTEVPLTVPMPEIEYEVALVALHDRVVDWPEVIEADAGAKEEMVGAGVTGAVTVTLVWQEIEPPAPVNVPA